MKAIEITEFGAPDVLKLTERPRPEPQRGEVLIKVAASGVNRPDVFQRKGAYAPPPGASDLPGLEIAGEIVGGDLSDAALNPFGLKLGDRVCALLAGGGYAEYATVPLLQCLPVPRGLTDIEAASLPETFFTVWSNVFDRAQLGAGEGGEQETLLVQGGSSGIGVTAIQIAHALGFRVFATAGTADKCRACEALGAERAIDYKTEDFVEVVKSLTNDRGVDVILDMVAGSYVPRELSALADGGRLVIIALLGGAKAEVNLGEILRRRLTITGSTLRPRPVEFKAQIAAQLKARVWPLIEDGRIEPVIYRVLPAADAAQAHALMESSEHIGKIVLDWGTSA
ncbi:NAD(P)H-quinone oxidoreductase [Burkholderia multivorans]|uniref:NAD(P)H-quinone oxidoreductase n=1 Tax=Burkholderia multivorans TaxID=87883 RepID=UPI000CFFA3BF|nr:NAD(P)H-quinone oxidoreductase [Burkholderia multivorans]MBJ9617387.1 NAD(P)H-quinone oxidoreductase [Burkholderia multivorans]MBU9329644.1 NAD(P)H-quinone oxidoreductase [Burkholderia multivorans]MBU9532526.1 NAD(P)H-quinone oxidoreductase [Burkholderia multivorans]MDR8786301.1 Phthiocerol/phenolphthiocerol synthesis polyketide synthase type I PpsC [Burkholderia multivorans]MDR8825983.1 Phthiocerol/phenolphthiocerol synthesis polyketide synthase type I PpsC [Burkholderia multivorans]